MNKLSVLFHKADVTNRKVLNKEEFVSLIDMAAKDSSVHFNIKWPEAPGRRTRRASLELIRPLQKYAENIAGSNQLHVDAEEAWDDCSKVPLRATDVRGLDRSSSVQGVQRMLGVNFAGFEAYWKNKMNIAEPDIPVLPEFMVRGNARTYTVVPDARRDRETERQLQRDRETERERDKQ